MTHCSRWLRALGAALYSGMLTLPAGAEAPLRFDVVVAGGSTAAAAAAFAAADEGATVALIEPTNWVGGQLTASAVPAVDEAWHVRRDPATDEVLLDVSDIARDPRNMTPLFRDALMKIGNPGRAWVSRFCFDPQKLIDGLLTPREQALRGRLTVFRNAAVKRCTFDAEAGRIRSLWAVQRTPRSAPEADAPSEAAAGYDRFPSQDLPDWYAEEDSPRFTKRLLCFEGDVFIDATEWGELLVLSDAPYLQGVQEDAASGDTTATAEGEDRIGQTITYCFVQKILPESSVEESSTAEEPSSAGEVEGGVGYGAYGDRPDAWSRIWTYRRILSSGEEPAVGDLCLQNWGYAQTRNGVTLGTDGKGEGGNDYPFGYVLLSKADSAAQRSDWCGGVDLDVLAAAERRALAWHAWFRDQAPAPFKPQQIVLHPQTLGTTHGLAKLPYIRDTRRSVGLDGFLLGFEDLTGPLDRKTGTRFADRVALGAYAADIHPLVGYKYPPHVVENHPTLPFYIPFRALTNAKYGNLLVAGKTMAQTFVANSATRLHPIEWSSGTAAGVAAATMSRDDMTSAGALGSIAAIQERVRRHTPINWTLEVPAKKPASR